jgi:hypothetical protein
MADLSVTPVGAGIKPVPGMSLGEMMNFARGAQQYRAAEQILPEEIEQAKQLTESKAIDLRLQRQKDVEYQNLIKAVEENPTLFQNETGQFDIQKVYKEVPKIAPLLGPDIIKNYQTIFKAQTESDKSLSQLTGENAGILGSRMVALGLQNKGKKSDYEEELKRLKIEFDGNPSMQKAITDLGAVIQNIPENQNMAQAAIGWGMSKIGLDKLSTYLPQLKEYVTQAGVYQGVVKPDITGAAPVVSQPRELLGAGVSPSNIATLTNEKDAAGRTLVKVLDQQGNVTFYPLDQLPANITSINTSAAPAAAPAAAPGVVAPKRDKFAAANVTFIPPGYTQEDQKRFKLESEQAVGQAQSATDAINSIANIRNSLDKAVVGNYSGAISAAQSVFGSVVGSKQEEYAASMRDVVKKELQNLANLKSAFTGTRFAGEVQNVVNSLATVESNPTAIRKVVNEAEALAKHAQNYASGLTAAINENPNNFFIKPEFDRRMAEAYDPKAIGMNEAAVRGNRKNGKEGARAALAEYFKENNINAADQARLRTKLDRYGALMDGNINLYDRYLRESKKGKSK